MELISQKIRATLGSRWFFGAIIIFFILEAAWIALSARYPMGFDENYHFGIIQLYARQWSPFFIYEPSGASVYGDLTRYPSYLFHYLMSFPYRLISEFIKNVPDQIVTLRFITIAIFTLALIAWRKVFSAAKISNSVANVVLLFFVLIPQVPYLAGQINYDNLLILCIATSFVLALKLIDNQNKKPGIAFSYLIILCLLSSLVKYTFLPVFVGLVFYFCYFFFRQRQNPFRFITNEWPQYRTSLKIVLVTLFILSISLFIERYGYNVIHYHNPVPDCAKVIGVDPCLDYGPWARNHRYETIRTGYISHLPFGAAKYVVIAALYTNNWAPSMFHQLFFVLRQDYAATSILPIPLWVASILTITGLLACIGYWSLFKKQRPLHLLLVVAIAYVVALWLLNFKEFLHFERRVAVQGRYLIPLLPVFILIVGLALNNSMNWLRLKILKPYLTVIIILLFLQGGGVVTYIVQTNPSWYWVNQSVVKLNDVGRKILSPLIIK